MKADKDFSTPIIDATREEVEAIMHFRMKEFKKVF
jgi:hypothetical protein